MAKEIFAINSEKRAEITLGLLRQGVTGTKGLFDKIFNQIAFGQDTDYLIGTQSGLALNDCNLAIDPADGRIKDKSGNIATLGDYDRIYIKDTDLINSNVDFKNADGTYAKHLQVKHLNGGKINLGFSTGTVPFKIKYAPVIEPDEFDFSFWDIRTNLSFYGLDFFLTNDQKRYFGYQGKGGKIIINGDTCYHGLDCGGIEMLDTDAVNPYLLRAGGQTELWQAGTGFEDSALFRMFNYKIGGFQDNSEIQGTFTNPGTPAGFFRVNDLHRFPSDISSYDLDIHNRPSATTAISGTVDIVGDTVSNLPAGSKNGMRIQGGVIPGGSTTTIILVGITSGSAKLYNPLTKSLLSPGDTIGVSVTIDTSGASNGSYQDFAMQGHDHFLFANTNSDTALTTPTQNDSVSTLRNSGNFQDYTMSRNLTSPTEPATLGRTNANLIEDKHGHGLPIVSNQTTPSNTGFKFYRKA